MTERIVLVLLGTDHHRFDRLVRWAGSWRRPDDVRLVVQTGPADPPPGAESKTFFEADELMRLFDHANVVVTHGGAGAVTDALEKGIRPIVVPRTRRLNECVDEHQELFADRMALEHGVVVARTEEALHAALDQALADPASMRMPPVVLDVADAVRRFGELVEQLFVR